MNSGMDHAAHSSNVYEQLTDQTDIGTVKAILKLYLREQTEILHPVDSEKSRQDIAYSLAGLLSLDLIRRLPRNDPYVEVLDMAGQLELPETHRSQEATWQRLTELIVALE